MDTKTKTSELDTKTKTSVMHSKNDKIRIRPYESKDYERVCDILRERAELLEAPKLLKKQLLFSENSLQRFMHMGVFLTSWWISGKFTVGVSAAFIYCLLAIASHHFVMFEFMR